MKGLSEFADISGVSSQTPNNWHKSERTAYRRTGLYCGSYTSGTLRTSEDRTMDPRITVYPKYIGSKLQYVVAFCGEEQEVLDSIAEAAERAKTFDVPSVSWVLLAKGDLVRLFLHVGLGLWRVAYGADVRDYPTGRGAGARRHFRECLMHEIECRSPRRGSSNG